MTSRGTYMPRHYVSCKKGCALVMQTHKPPGWNLASEYELVATIFTEREKTGDVDQLIGTIMDAGEGIFWDNDRRVYKASVIRKKASVGETPGASVLIVDRGRT